MQAPWPTVLVIDADPATHVAVSEALAEEEVAVLGARSAALGADLADRRPPVVLVADAQISAPIEALIAGIKAQRPELRVVLLASAPPPEHLTRLAALGLVLLKPVAREQLQVAVRNMVRLHRAASDEAELTPEPSDGPRAQQSSITRKDSRS